MPQSDKDAVPVTTIMDRVARTVALHHEFTTLQSELEQEMMTLVTPLFPSGLVVNMQDLATFKRMPWWVGAWRYSGNDRGTCIFRVERLMGISFNVHSPEHSYWSAEVTPISEKTGKPMSARTNGVGSSSMVMRGQLAAVSVEKEFESAAAYSEAARRSLTEFLKTALAKAAATDAPALMRVSITPAVLDALSDTLSDVKGQKVPQASDPVYQKILQAVDAAGDGRTVSIEVDRAELTELGKRVEYEIGPHGVCTENLGQGLSFTDASYWRGRRRAFTALGRQIDVYRDSSKEAI